MKKEHPTIVLASRKDSRNILNQHLLVTSYTLTGWQAAVQMSFLQKFQRGYLLLEGCAFCHLRKSKYTLYLPNLPFCKHQVIADTLTVASSSYQDSRISKCIARVLQHL